MQCYLVGGAVRDTLLGVPVHERDWVVVGATSDDMLRQGYRQVGRDFPVFLHPHTHEEYALARTERKQGIGHVGFVVHADGAVTLEEDLLRRDLTINALAQTDDGTIVDPFDGQRDLQTRVLRHVSPAFVEDPLRVFRVARFASQLAEFKFEIAPETLGLMRRMAELGELATLSAERVWAELVKALAGAAPVRFFSSLRDAHALLPWFVELVDRAAPLDALAAACATGLPTGLRFAALLAAIEAPDATALAARLRAPKDEQQLGVLAAREGGSLVNWRVLSDNDLLGLFERCDAFRRSARFVQLVTVIAAVRGVDFTQLIALAAGVRGADVVIDPDTPGQQIGRRVREQRLVALARTRAAGDASQVS